MLIRITCTGWLVQLQLTIVSEKSAGIVSWKYQLTIVSKKSDANSSQRYQTPDLQMVVESPGLFMQSL